MQHQAPQLPGVQAPSIPTLGGQAELALVPGFPGCSRPPRGLACAVKPPWQVSPAETTPLYVPSPPSLPRA